MMMHMIASGEAVAGEITQMLGRAADNHEDLSESLVSVSLKVLSAHA